MRNSIPSDFVLLTRFIAWGAASLGSIDVTLWAVAFSPSNLSLDAG